MAGLSAAVVGVAFGALRADECRAAAVVEVDAGACSGFAVSVSLAPPFACAALAELCNGVRERDDGKVLAKLEAVRHPRVGADVAGHALLEQRKSRARAAVHRRKHRNRL